MEHNDSFLKEDIKFNVVGRAPVKSRDSLDGATDYKKLGGPTFAEKAVNHGEPVTSGGCEMDVDGNTFSKKTSGSVSFIVSGISTPGKVVAVVSLLRGLPRIVGVVGAVMEIVVVMGAGVGVGIGAAIVGAAVGPPGGTAVTPRILSPGDSLPHIED